MQNTISVPTRIPTDEETVNLIEESANLQYFIGLPEFQLEAPFDESLMTHFMQSSPRRRSTVKWTCREEECAYMGVCDVSVLYSTPKVLYMDM